MHVQKSDFSTEIEGLWRSVLRAIGTLIIAW